MSEKIAGTAEVPVTAVDEGRMKGEALMKDVVLMKDVALSNEEVEDVDEVDSPDAGRVISLQMKTRKIVVFMLAISVGKCHGKT